MVGMSEGELVVSGKIKPTARTMMVTAGFDGLSRAFRQVVNAQPKRKTQPEEGSVSPDQFVVQQVPLARGGVRLDGHHPQALSLISASNGDCEHIVFATIMGDPGTILGLFKSHEACKVVSTASNGTVKPAIPSGVLLAIGFNRHQPDSCVAVKIRALKAREVEVKLITASGIVSARITDAEFDQGLARGLLSPALIKSIKSQGTVSAGWLTGVGE
jgi:hypothetical protein